MSKSAAAKKLCAQGGLTILELLITLFLVTLAGGIIAATVDLSTRQFNDRTQDADAQLLCSALSLFVQNELIYAEDIASDAGTVKFTDHVYALGSGCSFDVNTDGRLVLNYSGNSYEAVGAGSYKGRKALKVTGLTIAPSGDTVQVTIVVSDKKGTELATSSFTVKPIAP